MKFQVVIPEWESTYKVANKTATKYWLWKDRDKLPLKYKQLLMPKPLQKGGKEYCIDREFNRFIKNTKKAGKENLLVINGQTLYNQKIDWRLRAKVAEYFHNYYSNYILEQLKPIEIPEGKFLSISCDIYEIPRGNMPDVSNMWVLEKFFEDALTECKIIPDDGPKYVKESGRKKYHWVEESCQRKLIFTIEIID